MLKQFKASAALKHIIMVKPPVYWWKIQEDPVKGSITWVNLRTQFWMVHFISSMVLCKSSANQFTSMTDKIIPIDQRQRLWRNFIYCLDENKLKRVHEKKETELRTTFREKLSWKVYCLMAIWCCKQQRVLWVASSELDNGIPRSPASPAGWRRDFLRKEVLRRSDANDEGSVKWRLLQQGACLGKNSDPGGNRDLRLLINRWADAALHQCSRVHCRRLGGESRQRSHETLLGSFVRREGRVKKNRRENASVHSAGRSGFPRSRPPPAPPHLRSMPGQG